MRTDLLGHEARAARARPVFLGLNFDTPSFDGLIQELASTSGTQPYRYLVTPNVDHLVRLTDAPGMKNAKLWDAYRMADYCVCDSRVVATLAQIKAVRLTVVPGSDLTERLFAEAIEPGDIIAIVGGNEHTLPLLLQRWPDVKFLQHIPPMGLAKNGSAMSAAAAFVKAAGARFTFLAVGSPQQELLAAKIKQEGGATGIAFCVGAAIDFLLGIERRAPKLLQRLRLEWAHRLASDPRRLWRRYLVTGPRIFYRAARWGASAHESSTVATDR